MTSSQPTFSDLELQGARRVTRKAKFLAALDEMVPWDRWVALVKKSYPCGLRGRPPVGAEKMLRMYLVGVCYNLSDEACEDECSDSAAVRAFVGCGTDDAPDSTTLCKFRHMLEENGLGKQMLDELNACLKARGLAFCDGTIIDATFIESPSSTKNKQGARDPEARQGKKGNNWHFGYKAHVGIDADTGVVHTLVVTPANESDISQAKDLIRDDDARVWADAGYTGIEKRDEIAGNEHLKAIRWLVARRKSTITDETKDYEHDLSSVRSRVEHVFHELKDVLGIRKTRYKGKAKVENQLYVGFAISNLLLVARPHGFRRCQMPKCA